MPAKSRKRAAQAYLAYELGKSAVMSPNGELHICTAVLVMEIVS
jgi:hypothetical protein